MSHVGYGVFCTYFRESALNSEINILQALLLAAVLADDSVAYVFILMISSCRQSLSTEHVSLTYLRTLCLCNDAVTQAVVCCDRFCHSRILVKWHKDLCL